MPYTRNGWEIEEHETATGFWLVSAKRRFSNRVVEYCPAGSVDKASIYKDLDKRLPELE